MTTIKKLKPEEYSEDRKIAEQEIKQREAEG